jgi:hypothetical protein
MSFNSMVKRPKTLQPKSLHLLLARVIGNVKASGKRLFKTRILASGKDRENGGKRLRIVPRGPDLGR